MTDENERRYGVWCEVWGGVTGHRSAWLKNKSTLASFATLADAEAEAERLRATSARSLSRASFRYTARPL